MIMQIKTKRSLIYKVKEDDTFLSISNNLKVDIKELKILNNIQILEPNTIILLPKPYEHCYIVKPLDTYQKIAQTLNITVEKLQEITNNKKLFIGQQIIF